jgi:hypothetical protein
MDIAAASTDDIYRLLLEVQDRVAELLGETGSGLRLTGLSVTGPGGTPSARLSTIWKQHGRYWRRWKQPRLTGNAAAAAARHAQPLDQRRSFRRHRALT